MFSPRLLALLVAATLTVAPPAMAESAVEHGDAAALDAEARAAFGRKDYAEAARLFRRAFRVEPHPATKYNEGRAWDLAGARSAAADALELSLTLPGLDTARATAASRRLAELKVLVISVEVTRPLGATVTTPSGEVYPIPARFHLDPGAHELVIETANGKVKRAVKAEAGAYVQIAVDVPPVAVAAPPPAAARPAIPAMVDDTPRRGPAYVAFGLGAAFAVSAGVLGFMTLGARSDYVETRGVERERAADRFDTYKTWTNISLVAVGVAATTGVVLWFTSGSKSTPTTAAHVGPSGATFIMSF